MTDAIAINAAAAEYFARRMTMTVDGQACAAYLAARGFTIDAITAFGLGASGPDRVNLASALSIPESDLLAAGLLVDRDGRLRNRFRDRLMFPIHDAAGQVVGFSGRVLDATEPKYLNSPASPHFAKGELLYNLHRAAPTIRKTGAVFIVEGNFDVLRVSLAGFPSVVAPLGTSLTTDHARTIASLARTAYLLFDNDAAGRRATFKGGDLLLSAGLAVRVVRIPDGEDPDSLVAKIGRHGLERLLAEAPDVLDRKIELLEAGNLFRDIARKRESIERLLPTLRAATGAARELYVARVCEKTGLKPATIEGLLPTPTKRQRTKRPAQWERDLMRASA